MIENKRIQTQNIDRCFNCGSDSLIYEKEVICRNCGMVQDKILSNESYIKTKNENTRREFRESLFFKFYYGNQIRYPGPDCNLSRIIKRNIYESKSFYSKGRYIGKILTDICKKLLISNEIRLAAFYRYIKIDKSIKIRNNVVCIAYCLWDSIKLYKNYTTLKTLIKAFGDKDHRLNNHLIIKAGMIYGPILQKNNIRKSEVKTPLTYIPGIINSLKDNSDQIEEWIIKRGINYFNELKILSCNIANKISSILSGYGPNPFSFAVSIVYLADKLLSLKNKHTRILTHKNLSYITGIPSYSIRDIYNKNLKKIYKNHLNKIGK